MVAGVIYYDQQLGCPPKINENADNFFSFLIAGLGLLGITRPSILKTFPG
jgi:hypothetical protein